MKAFLYGSVPPPKDSVWKAAKEKNYVVQTFLRSDKGREKEVDVAMASDITKNLSRMALNTDLATLLLCLLKWRKILIQLTQ